MELEFEGTITKDGERWVSIIETLGLATFGDTVEAAVSAMHAAVEEFFEVARDLGQLGVVMARLNKQLPPRGPIRARTHFRMDHEQTLGL